MTKSKFNRIPNLDKYMNYTPPIQPYEVFYWEYVHGFDGGIIATAMGIARQQLSLIVTGKMKTMTPERAVIIAKATNTDVNDWAKLITRYEFYTAEKKLQESGKLNEILSFPTRKERDLTYNPRGRKVSKRHHPLKNY